MYSNIKLIIAKILIKFFRYFMSLAMKHDRYMKTFQASFSIDLLYRQIRTLIEKDKKIQ